jgi:hypothetical protein
MVNRLEEWLQDLDSKNKIALYIMIVAIAGVIYYYFNYSVLYTKINKNEKKIVSLKKKLNLPIKNYAIKLPVLTKKYKNLLTAKNKRLQDLEYLNERINISFLHINEKDFYALLENILNESYNLKLTPSFYISQSFGTFKKYIINIEGAFGYCQEKNVFDLIKFLESRKYVVSIDKFNLDNNGSLKFFIRYNIWGIK